MQRIYTTAEKARDLLLEEWVGAPVEIINYVVDQVYFDEGMLSFYPALDTPGACPYGVMAISGDVRYEGTFYASYWAVDKMRWKHDGEKRLDLKDAIFGKQHMELWRCYWTEDSALFVSDGMLWLKLRITGKVRLMASSDCVFDTSIFDFENGAVSNVLQVEQLLLCYQEDLTKNAISETKRRLAFNAAIEGRPALTIEEEVHPGIWIQKFGNKVLTCLTRVGSWDIDNGTDGTDIIYKQVDKEYAVVLCGKKPTEIWFSLLTNDESEDWYEDNLAEKMHDAGVLYYGADSDDEDDDDDDDDDE